MKSLINILNDDRGFTLIELIIVVAIISITSMIVITRMTNITSDKRENFAIFTSFIAKTYDDSFLNNRTNLLTIYLQHEDPEEETPDELLRRRNGIGVLIFNEGENSFKDTSRKLLQFREFPASFAIEEVVLASGKVITQGYEMIPYYPLGYSDQDRIIHVMTNDTDRWSIKISKHLKEPEVLEGYVTFENMRDK